MPDFPWPVTDDELVLNKALEQVLASYRPAGDHETALIRDAAIRLLAEAYQEGLRDEDALVHQTLKALQAGSP
ncbi:MAG: hypothetical protein JOY90_30900 [Bradyrhizobium sp.]|uniref:hypothetical protein n=1 Tax=Bradyrhizobium sp. TaxID=376 RepID=UPI001D71E0DF|nr:hypothetical protein [Bradyrhizobium sp.]MBV9564820.1 hypothetical protein [Bradyrhizobium sp.]